MIIFLILFGVIIVLTIINYKEVLNVIENIITLAKSSPFFASFAIIMIYVFLVTLAMPIVFLTIPLGYAFNYAF